MTEDHVHANLLSPTITCGTACRVSIDHDIAPLSKTQKRRHQREVALARKLEHAKQDEELWSLETQEHRNVSRGRQEKGSQHRQHKYQYQEQKWNRSYLSKMRKMKPVLFMVKKVTPSGSSHEHVAGKVEQANQEHHKDTTSAQEAKKSSPVGRRKVEVLRNKPPPFAPEGWAAIKNYHKTYSPLALYEPT